MRHGNVGDGAPDPVGLVIDPEDPNGDSGTSRRASPFGITAQAVDAAVQRHKHAVHIHHTDSTDITVANGISAQGFLIRVFSRLFHGGGNPNMVTVAAIHIQDLDEDALAGLEASRRIHPALVAQFFKGNVALHAKQVDEDSCTDGRDNSGFRANTGIDAVVAVPVCAEIHFFSSGTHSLKTARRCNTGFGIAILYWFFGTELGCSIRATGCNANMARAQGINTNFNIVLGLMLSNGLVAFSGALLSQYQGFADVQMGRGAIVIGLAAVVIGEAVFSKIFRNFALKLLSVGIGSVIYYIVMQICIWFKIDTDLLKMLSAIVVAIFLAVPYWKAKYFTRVAVKKGGSSNA